MPEILFHSLNFQALHGVVVDKREQALVAMLVIIFRTFQAMKE